MTTYVEQYNKLIGHSFSSVVVNDDQSEVIFTRIDGVQYKMHHAQDCCESVYLEDICGDLEDLLHSPIFVAEAVREKKDTEYDSVTWTFYKFATVKGRVTFRWYGASNGYYSESVDFEEIIEPDKDYDEI